MKKSGRFLCLFFWVLCCCGRLSANEFGYVTPGIDYPQRFGDDSLCALG